MINLFKRLFNRGRSIAKEKSIDPIQKKIDTIYLKSYLKNQNKRYARTKSTKQFLSYE